jgi:hypothetical protein
MNIVFHTDNNTVRISEYMDFNQIPYTKVDCWDSVHNYLALPDALLASDNTLFVIDHLALYQLSTHAISRKQLIDFCSGANNHIWVWSDIDGLVMHQDTFLLEFDTVIPSGVVTLFFDAMPPNHHWLSTKLRNVTYQLIPYNICWLPPRLSNAYTNKSNCSKEFMLTMVRKRSRPHRNVLWKTLTSVPGLIDHGHAYYRLPSDARAGQQPAAHNWHEGSPSMDLYLDSWLEIVPETMYKNGYYCTEKTTKPIVTKTPFLMVSSCHFLKYLKQFGFKTFNSIIDESYDQEFRIEDRVKLVVEQLQDIIVNGAESFYHACEPILEHNQNRLFEMFGHSQNDIDLFIRKNLDAIGFK